jgi:phage baseplate assembly protein W|tara:strand:+ start:1499 stop:1900 length:402 start_codon:yes stop_codon:yes gene_type:complete
MAKKALGLKIPFRLGQDGYFETNTDTISQVSSNIRNLLLTKPGERRFNNAFGSSLYKVLFDQNELGEMLPMLVNLIQNDVNRFMNGIIVEDVKVQLLENDVVNNDYNKIFIKVAFSYKELKSTTEVIITNNNI